MSVLSFVLERAASMPHLWMAACLSLSLGACDVFDEQLARRASAVTTRDCMVHADCAGPGAVPTACVQPEGRCVPLESDDCSVAAGSLSTPETLVVGGLFSLTGTQAAAGMVYRQSATLAIEQLNGAGGLPEAKGTSARRPLVLVACDEAANLSRAAGYLVDRLKVPAIVGPTTSQNTITVSSELTVPHGTLLLSPTSLASGVADLRDDDLTWQLTASDAARAPLLRHQLEALAAQLARERGKAAINLSVLYRSDALGIGTRESLGSVIINGKALDDPRNVDEHVQIAGYADSVADQMAIVRNQVAFAPDLVLLAGTAEAITKLMIPIEQQWKGGPRPYYVLTDSLRLPELFAATVTSDDLRRRVRGISAIPSERSAPVFDTFRAAYQMRFPGSPTTVTGMGQTYDAVLAIGYALAAMRDAPVSGANIALGLRKLSGGMVELALDGSKIQPAFAQLANGSAIRAIGTFAPLVWDAKGAPAEGTIEVWCIASGTPSPSFRSGKVTLDIKSQTITGDYEPCP